MTDLLQKEIKLDLSKVPVGRRAEAKKAVGEFLLNEVDRSIERGFSPVEGEGQFQILTKEYADDEKGGRRIANLNLEGDLKEAVRFKNTVEGIKYGIFLKSQNDKADGHNQLSDKAKAWARSKETPFPKRRFIPDKNQRFTDSIEKGMSDILKSFEQDTPEPLIFSERETIQEEETTLQLSINDSAIEAEIRRQLFGEE